MNGLETKDPKDLKDTIFSKVRSQVKDKKEVVKSRWEEYLAGALVVITLIQATLGGCTNNLGPNTSQATITPQETPNITQTIDPTAEPSASIVVTPEPSETPTQTIEPIPTPIATQSIDEQIAEILKNADESQDQLGLRFIDDTPARVPIIYGQLLTKGYITQEFNNEKIASDMLLKILAVLEAVGNIGIPNNNNPISGIYYDSPEATFVYNYVDKAILIFGNQNDQLFYKYFLDRGRLIKGYDREHSPNIDQLSQETYEAMGKLYIDGEPIILENGIQISFDDTTPLCQYATTCYLKGMGILLKAKAEKGVINLDQTNYSLDDIINKASGLIKPLKDKCYYEWLPSLSPCPSEIEDAIHSDKDVKTYLKVIVPDFVDSTFRAPQKRKTEKS